MLKSRIQILKQGNVISEEVAEYVNQVIDLMYVEIPEADMSKAEMFTTHLAMATQRIFSGKPVDSPDEAIWEEIKEDSHFTKAEAFCNKIQSISPISCPEGEKRFIILHLCNLLQE